MIGREKNIKKLKNYDNKIKYKIKEKNRKNTKMAKKHK